MEQTFTIWHKTSLGEGMEKVKAKNVNSAFNKFSSFSKRTWTIITNEEDEIVMTIEGWKNSQLISTNNNQFNNLP